MAKTTAVALTRVPAWAWALMALAVFASLYLLQENGLTLSPTASQWLHEITHDARHAMGVPCH